MEGRWSGGQEGRRRTENAYLEKIKKQINEDMALENVSREVILSVIYPITIMRFTIYLFIQIVQVQVTISDDKFPAGQRRAETVRVCNSRRSEVVLVGLLQESSYPNRQLSMPL